jgi:rubredoxin
MAHFLEHMLFMGSKKYAEEDYFMKIISKYNGVYNAFTELNFTVYYCTIESIGLDEVLDVLLNHAVIDKSIRPDDMLTGDKNAILLALRSTGYGDDYEVKMTCPECIESYKTTVKLSGLKYKPLQGEPDQNGEFSVQLPKLKMLAKFRLLTGKDENYLTKRVEALKKIKKNTGESNLLTERYILQLMEINGNRDKIYISNIISKMPISDSYYLREYIGLVEPGVDMDTEFECTNCGHVYEDTVPITAKLFWPNAKV